MRRTIGTVAPTSASTSTLEDASWFITTTDQGPPSGFQVTVCGPVPSAWAVQMSLSAGARVGDAPACWV